MVGLRGILSLLARVSTWEKQGGHQKEEELGSTAGWWDWWIISQCGGRVMFYVSYMLGTIPNTTPLRQGTSQK